MKIFGSKKFHVAATLASVSLLTVGPVKSIDQCSKEIYEDESCYSWNRVDATQRTASDYSFQDTLNSLLLPETISNQFTDIVVFQTITALGWLFAGTFYQILIHMNLDDDTRKSVEQYGFWFAPEKYSVSMGINIRNTIFGFFLGRVMYNVITDPAGTQKEFESITFETVRETALSSKFLTTWTGRYATQFISLFTGIAVLYAIGAAQETLFSRSFESRHPLDDLNDSVQAGISQNFL